MRTSQNPARTQIGKRILRRSIPVGAAEPSLMTLPLRFAEVAVVAARYRSRISAPLRGLQWHRALPRWKCPADAGRTTWHGAAWLGLRRVQARSARQGEAIGK